MTRVSFSFLTWMLFRFYMYIFIYYLYAVILTSISIIFRDKLDTVIFAQCVHMDNKAKESQLRFRPLLDYDFPCTSHCSDFITVWHWQSVLLATASRFDSQFVYLLFSSPLCLSPRTKQLKDEADCSSPPSWYCCMTSCRYSVRAPRAFWLHILFLNLKMYRYFSDI
jgi:hypothetical protein